MFRSIKRGGVVFDIDCKLGSGIRDSNGFEIFEGNIVNARGEQYNVSFRDGAFWLDSKHDSLPLNLIEHHDICVIRH